MTNLIVTVAIAPIAVVAVDALLEKSKTVMATAAPKVGLQMGIAMMVPIVGTVFQFT